MVVAQSKTEGRPDAPQEASYLCICRRSPIRNPSTPIPKPLHTLAMAMAAATAMPMTMTMAVARAVATVAAAVCMTMEELLQEELLPKELLLALQACNSTS